MTNQQKMFTKSLIANGSIQEAIEYLQNSDIHESEKKTLLAIASRYQRLHSKRVNGTISFEQSTIVENQIVENLIGLIHFPEDLTHAPDLNSVTISKIKSRPYWNIKSSIAIGVFIILIFAWLSWYIREKETPQLTVYVTDVDGNVVLEHQGEINTSIGNRPMRETIGENGRTNFGDILPRYLGDSISIGFIAEGWELADANRNFAFNGRPIYLKIKKNDNLGIVKGLVMTQAGQRPVEGAKVIVNADTAVYTDRNGAFFVVLPERMRVRSATDYYKITVIKDGYKPTSQFCLPTIFSEVRLK